MYYSTALALHEDSGGEKVHPGDTVQQAHQDALQCNRLVVRQRTAMHKLAAAAEGASCLGNTRLQLNSKALLCSLHRSCGRLREQGG